MFILKTLSSLKKNVSTLGRILVLLLDEEIKMTDQQFEEIFILYKQDVMNIAFCFLRHAEDAEDVTIDVFSRFYAHPSKDLALAKAYLIKMAINASLDLLRKRKYYAEFDESVQPGNRTESEESDPEIMAALRKLPKRLAIALTLVYLSGLSAKEAAAVIGCSEAALRKRLFRGKSLLKEALQNGNRRTATSNR